MVLAGGETDGGGWSCWLANGAGCGGELGGGGFEELVCAVLSGMASEEDIGGALGGGRIFGAGNTL